MKFTATTISVAVLIIGTAGFFLGRLSIGSLAGADASCSPRLSSPPGPADLAPSKRLARQEDSPYAAAVPKGEDGLKHLEAVIRDKDSLDRTHDLLAYIEQLSPEEFEGAVGRFRSLGLTKDRMGEFAMLLTAWAKVDPAAALAYTQAHTHDPFATKVVLSTWGAKDPAAARSWVDSLPNSSFRSAAKASLASQLAKGDPQGTAAWLLADSGDKVNSKLDNVFHTWAKQDQAGALAAYNALPAGPARDSALRGIADATTAKDPPAGAALLEAHPTDVSDKTIKAYAWEAYKTDPALGASALAGMSDPKKQTKAYKKMLDTWVAEAPTLAKSWIQTNQLPPPIKQRFGVDAAP